jgi:hypothetical protein
MKNVYAVRTLPVLDVAGNVAGWVRADVFADGTKASDMVFLRDGSAYAQAEAMERINADRSLLYETQEEAAGDGLARLREAHGRGGTTRVRARGD